MRRTTDRRSAGAGVLATDAVEDVGKRMGDVWHGNTLVEDLIEHTKNTYFKHPAHVAWMDEKVSQWKDANAGKVQDATVKSRVEHHSAQIEDFLNNTLPDAINAAKNALGL